MQSLQQVQRSSDLYVTFLYAKPHTILSVPMELVEELCMPFNRFISLLEIVCRIHKQNVYADRGKM